MEIIVDLDRSLYSGEEWAEMVAEESRLIRCRDCRYYITWTRGGKVIGGECVRHFTLPDGSPSRERHLHKPEHYCGFAKPHEEHCRE